MNRRSSLCVVLMFAAGAMPAQEQPHHSPFGCSGHAVKIHVDRTPPLKFIGREGLPEEVISYDPQHKFQFEGGGPFASVTVELAGTVAEQQVGRASVARLGVYVETTKDNNPPVQMQFWQLVSTAKESSKSDLSSAQLAFDANRVAECLKEENSQCNFAHVALATPDPAVPIVDLSFTEDLGGANADNSQEAHILMDFRSSPPQVLVTADCAYNEGGGACTALDSGMAPRSDLQCDWVGDKKDFLCSEIMYSGGTAHRDTYLLTDTEAPLRSGEVATLAEAAQALKSQPGTTAKVRDIGVVAWVGELNVGSGKTIVLGSQSLDGGALFYFIPELRGGLGIPVVIWPHDFMDDGKGAGVSLDASYWTVDQGVSFVMQPIYDDPRLSVLQVVAKAGGNRLYWVGAASGQKGPEFDVVELAGGSRYVSCGDYHVPASVVAVEDVKRPFLAALKVQPSTVTSEGDARPIGWNNAPRDCVRPGELRWEGGKFQGTMAQGDCKPDEEPGYVQVDDAGKVKLSYQR
jgi:hypothetical protein